MGVRVVPGRVLFILTLMDGCDRAQATPQKVSFYEVVDDRDQLLSWQFIGQRTREFPSGAGIVAVLRTLDLSAESLKVVEIGWCLFWLEDIAVENIVPSVIEGPPGIAVTQPLTADVICPSRNRLPFSATDGPDLQMKVSHGPIPPFSLAVHLHVEAQYVPSL